MHDRHLKQVFWIAGIGLTLLGGWGWYVRLTQGHLDANYGSLIPWGLWVASYIYFIGLSAGSFLISALVYVFGIKRFEAIGRIALFTALITLLLALLSIWADLGHMGRAWHVMAYPNFKSPMAWMIWLYGAYSLLLAVELWFLVRRDVVVGARGEGWRARVYRVLALGSRDDSEQSGTRDRRLVKILATIGVPVAIMFHGGVGALFGVVAARPAWNSGLFPILFLLSALASGGALLVLVVAVFQNGWRRNRDTVITLGRLVLGLLLLDVLFQVSEYLIAGYGNVPGHVEGLKLIFTGPYWWVFWGWQLLLGTAIPIVLLASRRTSNNPRFVSLAGLLIAVGFIGLRLNIVIPALASEEIVGLSDAISSPRLSPEYFPSLSEWALTAGIVGLGLLLFGLGETLLPSQKEEAIDVRL
ncbi:MAG TPA: NrfD/PsrC family molybdoenzyme membrane anchor subunit [Acidimicrobiia bacterium]|nr:NrfD/PsrC family molybdoenzyme membrane anchor subunit [Acidimicrobiia bacterium]